MIQLAQNQLWKKDDRYLRIVVWERLAIRYKETDSPDAAEGTLHDDFEAEGEKTHDGRKFVGTIRSTFVLGPDAKALKERRNVRLGDCFTL